MLPKTYEPEKIEPKWQKFWLDEKVYKYELDEKRPSYAIDTPPRRSRAERSTSATCSATPG